MAFGKSKEIEVHSTPQLPADMSLAEQIKRDLANIGDQVGGAVVERIRLSPKGFTLPDGTTGATIQGIILDFVSANNHYPEVYNKDNPTPPNCFAMGRIPNLLAPDPSSPEPQADTCAVCPKNKFESGVGNSKACKNTRALGIMQRPATVDSPIWVLSVPPSSIKYFDTYVTTTLRAQRGITPIGAVTEIRMDQSKDFAAPRFQFMELLDDTELAFYYSRKAEAEAILLQKPTMLSS